MTLPVWLEGIRIERGALSDLPMPLTEKIQKEAHFMSVFKLFSQGLTHYILASETVSMAEDQDMYFKDSVLLPDFNFQAFTNINANNG